MRLFVSIMPLAAQPPLDRFRRAICFSRPFARPRSRRSRRLTQIAACVGLTVATGDGRALAQDAPAPIRLELNRLEPQGESCRAYLLIDNGKGEALKSLKVDLFAMDTDGVAQRRLAVEVGPVPARKTLIKLFDFAGLACPRFGRVLLNDVISCEGPSGPREDCVSQIETVSKVGSVAFSK